MHPLLLNIDFVFSKITQVKTKASLKIDLVVANNVLLTFGVCFLLQGITGEVGLTGAAGPAGDKGAAGATGPGGLGGPAGAKGEPGAPGKAGPTGLQGAAVSINDILY